MNSQDDLTFANLDLISKAMRITDGNYVRSFMQELRVSGGWEEATVAFGTVSHLRAAGPGLEEETMA